MLTPALATVLLPPPAFNAAAYAGLVMWLDPLRLALADGASVTSFTDQSGSANHGVPGTAPTYRLNRINGRPAVVLNSANSEFLVANGIATLLTGSDKPFTWFVVNRVPTPTGTQTLMSLGSSSATNPFHRLEAASSQWQSTRRSDTGGADTVTITAGVATGQPTVLCCRFTGTAVQLFANGTQLGADTAMDTTTLTVDRFSIGALVRTTNSNFTNGDLGDVIVYSQARTAAECYAIMRALARRWGIDP